MIFVIKASEPDCIVLLDHCKSSIDLWDNEITTVLRGLSDHNPNLQHISFTENKITFIDSNVFNNLLKLIN